MTPAGSGEAMASPGPVAVPRVWRALAVVARWQLLLTRRHRMGLVLLFAVMALCVGIRMWPALGKPSMPDREHAAIALRLLDATIARATVAPPAVATRPPATRRGNPSKERAAPGYALVLYAAAVLDSAAAKAIECRALATPCTGASMRTVLALQFVVVLAGLALVAAAALQLSGSASVALLTLLLAFVGSPLGEPASYPLPYVWPPALLFLFAYLLAASFARRSAGLALLAGAALGSVALFLPTMVIAVPLTALVLAFGLRRDGGEMATAVGHGVMLLAGAALVLVGALLLLIPSGIYDVSALLRGIAYDLALRTGFQSMGIGSAIAGVLLPLPVVGGVVELLAPTLVQPFGAFVPGTFITAGDSVIFRGALAASPLASGQLSWLWSECVLGDLGGYLLSMPPMLMRGIFGNADLVGLIGLLHMRSLFVWHGVDRRMGALAAIAAPFVLLLVLNTLLTASLPFANVPLVFLYAYAIAYIAGRL